MKNNDDKIFKNNNYNVQFIIKMCYVYYMQVMLLYNSQNYIVP